MWLPNKEKVSLKLHFKLKGGGEKRGKWRKEEVSIRNVMGDVIEREER